MKNIILVTLAVVLLSGMVSGCNKKKPVVEDPAFVDATGLGPAGTGDGTDTTVVRPDVRVVDTTGGAGTAKDVTDTTVRSDTTVTPPPAAGPTYTIKEKDTLWSIAARYLGSGKRWPEIEAANPGLDHKKLPIGQTIKIPQK